MPIPPFFLESRGDNQLIGAVEFCACFQVPRGYTSSWHPVCRGILRASCSVLTPREICFFDKHGCMGGGIFDRGLSCWSRSMSLVLVNPNISLFEKDWKYVVLLVFGEFGWKSTPHNYDYLLFAFLCNTS